jgi:CRP-like cAMP-binding protein
VVISGRLEARLGGGEAVLLGPGDLFGESGWIADERRRADVFVVEESTRILALSERTLRTLFGTAQTIVRMDHP